ncbi:RICIN domain-containing protein [Streptomyces sp. NPDC048290]|uniref:RICIN domain-containing protein n=1 Tax=Streptomyces sp. NPDC048290 TaxID=3155811 RepID=UPI003415275A
MRAIRSDLARRIRAGLVFFTVLVAALAATATPAQAFPQPRFSAPVNGGYFYFSNTLVGWDGCMDVRGGGSTSADGTAVQLWQCRVEWNQQFQTVRIGTVNGVDAWRLKPRYALSKCVRVKDAGHSVDIEIATCNSYDWEQMFQIEHVGGRGYRVRPVFNHWCLGPTFLGNGARIIMHPCNGDPIHIWRLSY